MSSIPHSPATLEARYGAPPRWRRPVLLGVVAVVVGALAVLWLWITVGQADPPAASSLVGYEIVDAHTATATIRVKIADDARDVSCTVRAIATDKQVVGQATFTPDPGDVADHDVEIATERRATAVELLGCTADGQPRPR